MNSNQSTISIVLIGLVLLSGFFSATETAYSSLNRIKIKSLANNGNKKAIKTLKIYDNYSKLITSLLIGNNVVNIIAASLATILFTNYFNQDTALTVSTLVMTLVVLIFGEVTPKNLAKKYDESWAMAVVDIVSFCMFILSPVIYIFEQWNKFINMIFKVEEDQSMTSDELVTIVEEAQNDGELEEHQSDLIVAAIEFNEMEVKEVLTPRVDVVAIDTTMSIEQIEKLFRENNFSRLPVYEKTIDNIVGVLHQKDFYYLYYTKSKASIRQLVKPVQYTSPHVKVSYLLRQLQNSKSHLAIVLDEYGGTLGIITMEDILEELVGEIYDEHDEIIEYYKKLNENTFLVNCEVDIDDMFEYFHLKLEEDFDFITASGWVISILGDIPTIGMQFEYKHLSVTVTDADKRKVKEIKVVVNKKQEEVDSETKKIN